VSDDHRDRQRDYWRAEDARYDRERTHRDQTEASERGWRALAAGDTAAAIGAVAGPDAALSYLQGLAEAGSGGEVGPGSWPPYQFPADLFEFMQDMAELAVQKIGLLRCERVGDDVRLEAYHESAGEEYFVGSCRTSAALVRQYLDNIPASSRSAHTERVARLLRSALAGE
jgi:hypothetical protein